MSVQRSCCLPGQVLTTELNKYALPCGEWKDCMSLAAVSCRAQLMADVLGVVQA